MKSRMSQHDSIEDWLELNEDKKPMRQGQMRVGKNIILSFYVSFDRAVCLMIAAELLTTILQLSK